MYSDLDEYSVVLMLEIEEKRNIRLERGTAIGVCVRHEYLNVIEIYAYIILM
jgi:hypothetical protein